MLAARNVLARAVFQPANQPSPMPHMSSRKVRAFRAENAITRDRCRLVPRLPPHAFTDNFYTLTVYEKGEWQLALPRAVVPSSTFGYALPPTNCSAQP